MSSCLHLHPQDNVAVLLEAVAADETVRLPGFDLTARQAIAPGHKIALSAIAAGEAIVKYGAPIGRATSVISPGEHVHSHNLVSTLKGDAPYVYAPQSRAMAFDAGERHFRGYRRADGRAATRNEIWILPTVGCVGTLAERVARTAQRRHAGRVDGIFAFKHPFGCSQLGDDLQHTRALIAALAQHPNAGGVLILGLGCESNQLDALIETIPPERRAHIRTLSAQSCDDEEAACHALIDELAEQCGDAERSDMPIGELALGVKCGGSDGFSGLTANPLVGRMADALAGAGGSIILTEIPEIFGAEHLLMERAASRAVFDAIAALVGDFKAIFLRHGEGLSDNPSPGNIAGGITTLEEKSLGAVQKGGNAPVTDVLRYGERVQRPGLSLLEAPGNDAISSTALAAAGATLILFTTGRGTPLGFPAPTIKIASNSALASRKAGWIDFDAGQILSRGFDEVSAALLNHIIAVASGEPSRSEANGERDIAIWKSGITL
ncbi:UxaA family hydrolase [Sphingopyxis sp. MWB1]|uniref:UxaA family hydrolase n=1 Tax=Sphingopyxis sp. MWB1 TaxID=1537715 RepID=UPI000519FBFB|nr:altronate dehydratase family protein [Sphingopyxis sp. MWB1]